MKKKEEGEIFTSQLFINYGGGSSTCTHAMTHHEAPNTHLHK